MAGAADINVKIALDGEKGYRQALKNCNDALKNAQSSLKLFDEQAQGNANTLETLEDREKKLQEVLGKATEKQEAMNGALEEAKKKRDDALEALQKAVEEHGEESKEVEKAEKAYLAAENQVDRYQTQVNKAATEVEKINKELEDNEKYIDEAKDSTDGCATSIDKYGKEVKDANDETKDMNKTFKDTVWTETLTKVMDKLSGAFDKVSAAAKDANEKIETGLKNVVKKTGATGEELEKFREMAEEAFTNMPVSIEDAADAIGEVATRFKGLTDNELSDLSEKFLEFSQLNDTDVTTSIDNVQTALYAFGLEADSANDYLDVLTTTAQNSGADVDDLASKVVTNAAAFHDMGMDIYEATSFLGDLELAGADSNQVMQGMKTALKEAAEEGKPLNEVLSDLQKTISESETDAEGLNAAYDVFGTRAGPAVFNAVKNGQIDFTNLASSTDILAEAQGRLDQSYEDSLTVYDKMQTAQNNLDSALSTLRGSFNEALTPAIETATEWIKDITQGFKDLPPEIQTTIGVIATIGSTAMEVIPQVVSLIAQIKLLKIAKSQAGNIGALGGSMESTGSSSSGLAKTILGGIGILTAFGAAITVAGEEVEKANKAAVEAGAAYEIDLKNGVNDARVAFDEVVTTLDDVETAQQAANEAVEIQKTALDALNEANEDYTDFLVKYPAFAEGYAQAGDTIQDNTGKSVTVTKELWQEYESLKMRTEEAADALDDANGLVKDSQDYLEDLKDAAGDAADAYDDAGDAVDGFAKDTEKSNSKIAKSTQDQMTKVATAVNGMKDSLKNGATSISNWFDAVEEREKLSADELAKNLQDQIDSVKNWEENLNYLADKGINQELLKYLADMGPSGANYVQAFVDAANGETEIGLDEMNALWEEKLDIEGAMNTEAQQVLNSVGTMVAGSQDELDKLAAAAYEAGEELPEGIADGIYAASYKAYDAAGSAVRSAKNGATAVDIKTTGENVGSNLCAGLVKGINNNADAVVNAAGRMINSVITVTKNIPVVASPSKVFEEIGKFLDLGLAQGIDKYADVPVDAVSEMTKDVVGTPDLSRYGSMGSINNQVAVYIGDKELTALMAAGVVKNISTNQRARYAAAGG